jgi:PAS domain S-box-containing protein
VAEVAGGKAGAGNRSGRNVPSSGPGDQRCLGVAGSIGKGGAAGNLGRVVPDLAGSSALADAAALGLPALAGVLAGAQDGITVVDAGRRFVYANPAACQMLGYPLEQLRGRDFLGSIPAREHTIMLARFSDQLGGAAGEVPAPFTCNLRRPDGAEREVVYSQFAVDVAGSRVGVAIFQDLTGPRAAGRAAVALAQTAAQLVGAGTTEEILAGIARHAVEGTRALACGITVADDDHKVALTGGYGLPAASVEAMAALRSPIGSGSLALDGVPVGGAILTDKPVVLPDARSVWEANPATEAFAATLKGLDWQAAVFLPLCWEKRVFGVFGVHLPSGLAGPSEVELAFYTALADQAAVAVTSARLGSQARQAAALLERTRLARELHDSVSQALFSMTMHARAAQLSLAKAGLDESGPLGRAVAELAELTRGALAEMRALIFELRPAALAEEGLVAALRKQGAALSARERVTVTVQGPEERLDLEAGVEEHLYRIASEALHNVVKHGGAGGATVSVTAEAGSLRVEVRDDGAGFDQDAGHPGHLGLSTMAERAETIGANLTITSAPGQGTTVAVSWPADRRDQGKAGPVRTEQAETVDTRARKLQPGVTSEPAVSGGTGQPAHGRAGDEPGRMAPDAAGSSAVADAAALGLPVLAGVLAGAPEGITIADASRRFVYANPAACQMLGHPLEQLRGQDFLSVIPAQEHNFALGRFSERLGRSLGEAAAPFSAMLIDQDGAEREIVCSTFAADVAGGHHGVTIFRDVTGPRAASRTAVALAQTAAQLVGAGTTDEVLAGIARHAVEGTQALACGISVVGDDHKLASGGGYGPGYGLPPASGETRSAGRIALADIPGEQVIKAMTAGSIVIGGAPGKPVVLPDARSAWEANPVTRAFAATLRGLDWQAGVYVPLSWEGRVFGLFGVYLPPGLAGPSEEELAFYIALADQAAVAVTNARLASQARQAAAVLERSRLARDLHDSVSQALFSMTMHARAAQLSLAKAGLEESGPLGRAVAQLAQLTRGALAEMRALIFELRPAALAEEGLVAALRKQAAALTAREETVITVEGPEERLDLAAGAEEHLYRIASEALHNVVKHARADRAAVTLTAQAGSLRVTVRDDGAGFDPDAGHAGHLGLSTIAERAKIIGADLTITSTSGAGTTVTVFLPRGRRDQEKEALGAR